MAGITSVITLEDRFSGTIKLFTSLLLGTFKPTQLLTSNMSQLGGTLGFLYNRVVPLYPMLDQFKGGMTGISMILPGIIQKFGNMNDIIFKVSQVFPALAPFATLIGNIFTRAKAGESLFGQIANAVVDLNLPFAGLVSTFLKIKAFFQGAGGKILKAIAKIAAVALAIKGVLTVGMLLEQNIPKAFNAVKSSIMSLPSALKNLHASLMLSDGPYGRYVTTAKEAFGKVKGAFGVLKTLPSRIKNLHASLMLSDGPYADYVMKAQNAFNKVKGAFGTATDAAKGAVGTMKGHFNTLADVTKTYAEKAGNYIKSTKAYQYAEKYVTMFKDKAKQVWEKYSPIVKAQMDKAATYIKSTRAYQFAAKYASIAIGKMSETFGPYVNSARTHFRIMQNEASWFVIGMRMRLFNLKEEIKDGTFYDKAKQRLSMFALGAQMRWAWYSGIARSHIKKITDAAKGTKAYQFLAEKYETYMSKIRNTEAYQKMSAAFGAFTSAAKSHLVKLAIAIKATAIAQAGLLKSMIIENGFFGGILKYIGYIKALGIQFIITKGKAVAAWLASVVAMGISGSWAGRTFRLIKGGVIKVYETVKNFWGKVPGIVKGAFAVFGIYSAIKGIKGAFDALGNTIDNWKNKVDDLIEKTNGMEKAKRLSMELGKETADAFDHMAMKLSLSTGISKKSIMDFNVALHRIGVGNESNKMITDLAAKFSVLNNEMDFEGISGALMEAIKSGSSEGLAALFNDNPLAKQQFKTMKLDKLLSKGDVKGFVAAFEQIANSVGYTDEKVSELTNTMQGKLKRASANLDRLSDRMKVGILDKLEPYVDKFLNLLESPEFQQQFEMIVRRFTGLIELGFQLFGGLIEGVVDFGMAAYKWWIEPTGGALRIIMLFLGTAKAIKWMAGIFHLFAFIGPMFLKGFGLAKMGVKGLKNGIMGAWDAYKRFKEGGISAVFRSEMNRNESRVKRFGRVVKSVAKGAASAMRSIVLSPGYVFAALFVFIGKGCQALVESITGESKGVIESVVDVIVGGTVTTFGYVKRTILGFINGIVTGFESGINAMIGFIEGVCNKLVEGFFWAKNKINKLFGEDEEEVVPLVKFGRVEFDKFDLETDEQIHERAKNAIDATMGVLPDLFSAADKAMDMMGLNDPESYGGPWAKLMDGKNPQLDDANKTLKGIRQNTGDMKHKMDLQWMKELAEQRFVNNVNVRQLTPTVNVKVSGSNVTPKSTADALAKELNQMADAGAFNAYGGKV